MREMSGRKRADEIDFAFWRSLLKFSKSEVQAGNPVLSLIGAAEPSIVTTFERSGWEVRVVSSIDLAASAGDNQFDLIVAADAGHSILAQVGVGQLLGWSHDALRPTGHLVFLAERAHLGESLPGDVLEDAEAVGFESVWAAAPSAVDVPISGPERHEEWIFVGRRP